MFAVRALWMKPRRIVCCGESCADCRGCSKIAKGMLSRFKALRAPETWSTVVRDCHRAQHTVPGPRPQFVQLITLLFILRCPPAGRDKSDIS